MRPKAVHLLFLVAFVTAFTSLFAGLAAPAQAGDCYTVWVGSTPTIVCPFQ